MNPYPGPRSVLILDNAKVHHTSAVQAAAEQAGILLVYLPPYSPMLNPVEFMFHEMKSFLRRHSLSLSPNYDHQQLLRLSLDYVQHHGYCANYMRHCGY
jgi:transposase